MSIQTIMLPRPSLKRPAALIATGFGVGFLPIAPGTWGSLLALPVAGIASLFLGSIGSAILLIVVCVIGLWATHSVLDGHNADPGFVVVDEIVGQWLTVLVVPVDPVLYAVGFILFRIADIVKPWPACWADRKVHGAVGVILDDVFAACYAGGALYIFSVYFYL